jgi:hypothetical protein
MDKAEWRASGDLVKMLEALAKVAGRRKFQLFTCACLRQLWGRTTERPFRKAVVYAERFAEGLIDRDELRPAFVRAWPWGWERLRTATIVAVAPLTHDLPFWRALEAANEVSSLLAQGLRYGGSHNKKVFDTARKEQVALVREVFGDPFREARFEPRWRTAEVARLAETVTEEGAWDELPVLADALVDAGCDDEEVLAHLRGPGPHVRGCWAVDLARGKAQPACSPRPPGS